MIDSTSDHRLTIASTVTLRLAVTSTTDSSLVVTGPGEVLCDDDGAGALDAAVVDTFRPGKYGIYIGHLGQAGTYRLEISETRCVVWCARPEARADVSPHRGVGNVRHLFLVSRDAARDTRPPRSDENVNT